MNRKGESPYSPGDAAVQKARKEGYRKGWDDRRILNESVIEAALWESGHKGSLPGTEIRIARSGRED
jgi:hypothetical protein